MPGEPTLDPQQTAQIASDGAKASGAHRLFVAMACLLLAGLVALGVGVAALKMNGDHLAAQQSAAAVAGQQLAQQVRQLGANPVVQPPTPVAAPPVTGARGPGPTQQAIDDAVAGYFAVHPPGATPAMVAVQVASYLTAHPPKPGPPPTPTQISTAASDYIAAHAADFQGQPGTNGSNGQDGQPGQNATDAQVQSAVDAYCDAHNQCQGTSGPQGVSVTDLSFARDDSGDCMVVVTLHDPATGDDSTITHPAGDAACQPLPTTDTPTTTPGLLGSLHR